MPALKRIPTELADCIRDPAEFVMQLQARRNAAIDRATTFHYEAIRWFAQGTGTYQEQAEFDRQFEV